jgi:hypothetical protein
MKDNSPAGSSVQGGGWALAQEPIQELLSKLEHDPAGRCQAILGIEGKEMAVIVPRQQVQAGAKSTDGAAMPRQQLAILERLDGQVPEPGDPSRSSAKGLDDGDRALLEKVEACFETVGELHNACKSRAAPSVPSGPPRKKC